MLQHSCILVTSSIQEPSSATLPTLQSKQPGAFQLQVAGGSNNLEVFKPNLATAYVSYHRHTSAAVAATYRTATAGSNREGVLAAVLLLPVASPL